MPVQSTVIQVPTGASTGVIPVNTPTTPTPQFLTTISWDPTTAIGVALTSLNLIAVNVNGNSSIGLPTGYGVSIPTSLSQIPGFPVPEIGGSGAELYYFEIAYRVRVVQNGFPCAFNGGIAIAPVGTSYGSLALGGPAQFGTTLNGNGGVNYNGMGICSLPVDQNAGSFQQGDVIGVAVDVNSRAVWFKCVAGPSFKIAQQVGIGSDWNGGGWNGGGIGAGSSPNNGSRAVSIFIGNGVIPMAIFGGENGVGNVALGANFGGDVFFGSVPVGPSGTYQFWPTLPTH